MNKPLILVADDDYTIRLVLEKKLNKEGYNTKSTSSGKELLSWVEKGEGDLVITDVVMEDSNGLELIPLMHQFNENLPIIIMSGLNTIKTAIDANMKGAYEYFPKPFDLEDVYNVVKKALISNKRKVDTEGIKKSLLDDDLPIKRALPVAQNIEFYRYSVTFELFKS